MTQLCILVLGMLTVWLLARTDKWHKFGYWVGLAAEPWWLYTAWKHDQWGIMLLCFWWGGWYFIGGVRRRKKNEKI